ncbi:MAG: phosphodiester glycosidase family protein [Bacteroidota bacterium]
MPKKYLTLLFILSVVITGLFSFCTHPEDSRFISYTADPSQIVMYYKDDAGNRYGSLGNLKSALHKKGKTLLFSMNGGMYKPDHSPQGLYIENYKTISPIDTASGTGNFYLKPNGVFYIDTNNKAHIATTPKFNAATVKYATQSGPMLVVNGVIHAAFKEGSANLQVRNGVGILPDGKAIFAMSKEKINFHDFALYFKNLGCKNALYLDGFVSRAYCPEQNHIQTDGDFGVIIGIVK